MAGCFLLLTTLGASAAAQLNLFIWSEYMDPAVIADFEKQYACKVTIDVYEDAESMLAKLQSGGVSLYDVVVPPDHIVPVMIKDGLLAPLRHTNVPNLKSLDERFARPSFDPSNSFTVAYQWGTVGLLVRQTPNKPVPRSWSLVFDQAKQPGPFLLIDSVRDMVGAALKYRGHSLNTVNLAELKEARDLIISARKRCAGFDGSVGGKNKVLAKTAQAAIVYSGEGVRAMREDPQTLYFIPEEGSQIWLDNLGIPAKAPHRDLAEKFINYLLEPKVGARVSNYTQYASPNQAALEFITPQDRKNPAIYPPLEALSKLEFLRDLGKNSRIYDELWTQVKAR